jgi:PLP dependent protein
LQCPEICWHFIGNLQSNKVSKIVKIPRLSVVETVTSAKLAEKLNSGWTDKDRKLKVMVQVNTSGEDNKNGVEPTELTEIVRKWKSAA